MLGDAQPLGAATTSGLLYDLGGYPGLVSGDGVVHGEVCAVDDTRLPALDAFEDYNLADPAGSLYMRAAVTAWLVASGEAIPVQAYRHNRPVPEHAWIPDGDYARYAGGRG